MLLWKIIALPFSPSRTIPIHLIITRPSSINYHTDGKVKLAIYDLAGKEIASLVNETKPAGIYKINFEAGKLSSGTYLCKIQCGDLIKQKS